MPVENFYGQTFVAFMDISGFKVLMQQGNAPAALDRLYCAGYYALRSHIGVEGFFVSDSGILFVKNNRSEVKLQLFLLLDVVKEINEQMLLYKYMLTTSIAYGEFSYHNRIEFPEIEKNPIYGGAYVTAFLDNESGSPKLEPALCRIVYNDPLKEVLHPQDIPAEGRYPLRLCNKNKHIKFYWNLNSSNDIDSFEERYHDSYNAKYAGMLKALRP